MKITVFITELITGILLFSLLKQLRMPSHRMLIYSWNPVVLWSFACDGHVDAVAIALLALALLFARSRRFYAQGSVISAAILVKFIPLMSAPAFFRVGTARKVIVAGAATACVLYGIYASAGASVIGFLPAYAGEERLLDGQGFWALAGLAKLGGAHVWWTTAYAGSATAGFLVIAFAIMRRGATAPADDVRSISRDIAILGAYGTAVISPHYAWYFAWLSFPCVFAPIPSVLWISSASVVIYISTFYDTFYIQALLYVPFIILSIFSMYRNTRPL